MVFFSCNACGESLKKNQVEKHCQFKCRSCEVLSCIDCSKEFWGDDYKLHIKCMTEEEKYSGKNYQPKANANKGEKKQEAWFEQVQTAIDKVSGTNYKMKSLLERLRDCPNVPRKQRKFENFVRSSLGVRDQRLVAEAWEAISSQQLLTANQQESQKEQTKETTNGDNSEEPKVEDNKSTDNTDTKEQKLSKRERKEERRKQSDKVEKKDKKSQGNGAEEKSGTKKAKKRKHQTLEEEDGDAVNGTGEAEVESSGKKTKKKKNRGKDAEQSSEDMSDSSPKKRKKQKGSVDTSAEEEDEVPVKKFQWEPVIVEVLSAASDKTLSMKRLKKKVLGEYHARGGDGKKIGSEEKLWAKFNKKVTKNPRFKVLKDKVKLVH